MTPQEIRRILSEYQFTRKDSLSDIQLAQISDRASRGGNVTKSKNIKKWQKDNPELVVEKCSKGGKTSAKLYNGKFFKEWVENNPELAAEHFSKAGKKGGNTNVETGHIYRLHDEFLEYNMQFLDREDHTCPHCNKVVNGGVYYRWHGDNCKELEKINEQITILSSLPKVFTSNDVVDVCKQLNYKRQKIKYGICKNPKYIKVIKEGTNQKNPSIFEKLY
jgi:hypothetical protein